MMGVKITGLNEVLKTLKKMGDEVEQKLCEQATAIVATEIRDEAKRRAYIAPESYDVYYQGQKMTFPPATVGDSVIIKNIPKSERAGLTSMHIVTVKGIPKKFASMLEYSRNTKTGRPMPFMRPALDAKLESGQKLAKETLEKRLKEVFDGRD